MLCKGFSDDEFCEQFACIEYILNQYQNCRVMICGDYDVYFWRAQPNTEILNDFWVKLDLCASARHFKNEVDYTYNFGMTRFSSLDHFLMSDVLFEFAVNRILVHHDIDNLSDHASSCILISLILCFAFLIIHLLKSKRWPGRSVVMLIWLHMAVV